MLSIIHKVPLIRLLLFYAMGVLAYTNGLDMAFAYIFMITGSVFLLLDILLITKTEERRFDYRWLIGMCIMFYFMSLGMFCANQTESKNYESVSKYYLACVKTLPKGLSGGFSVDMYLTELDEDRVCYNPKPFLCKVNFTSTGRYENLAVGDSLILFARHGSDVVRNPQVATIKNKKQETVYVSDAEWIKVSASNERLHSELIRESMIGMLKKKESMKMLLPL